EKADVAAIAALVVVALVPQLLPVGPVIGKKARVEGAAVVGAQEAVLGAHVEAAVRVVGRGEGGILVGRDVPVPGRGEHGAAAAGGAEFRKQETALARIVERKRD